MTTPGGAADAARRRMEKLGGVMPSPRELPDATAVLPGAVSSATIAGEGASMSLPPQPSGSGLLYLHSISDPELRTRLTKFDLDNDGYLDGSEIAMAFQAYEEKMQSIETGAVPFAFFPPEVQQNLTRYDESGDRMLDAKEIWHALEALEKAEAAQKRGALPFAFFPEAVQERLEQFDETGDRLLDAEEILHALVAFETQLKAAASGSIPFSSFPASAQEQLKELDETGDACLDSKEILAGIQALAREKKKTKRLMWLSAGLLVFSLLLLAAMGGLMFQVIEMTKESRIGAGGVMTSKLTGEPIQTASSEMLVNSDGVLSSRPHPDRRRRSTVESDLPGLGRRSAARRKGQACSADGSCPLTTVSQSVSTEHSLSSLLNDAYFEELKTLKISQSSSWIHFMVLAVARYQQKNSRYGSVVVLYTHVGELTLDGEAIVFEEALAGAFQRAGLRVDNNGRRLLGVTKVVGLFNLLESAFEGSGLEDDAMPRMPGDQFYLSWKKLEYCDDGNEKGCLTSGGRLPNWIENSTVTSFRPALVQHEYTYSQTFDGKPAAMTMLVSAGWPGFELVQLANSTHALTYQQYDNQRFHCALTETTELQKLINGAEVMSEKGRRLGEEKDGAKVESLGFETINDVYCRKFKVTQTVEISGNQQGGKGGSGKTQLEIFVWENYGARRLHRIQMMSNAWIVSELIPITHEGANILPKEAFDIQSILDTCDVPDMYAPKRIKPEIVQDMVLPSPQWGQPLPDFNETIDFDNTSITGVEIETTSPRRSGPAEIKHYDDAGNEITFKQKLALIYEDKMRQAEALRRRRSAVSSGSDKPKREVSIDSLPCSEGCCEIGASSLGEDIEKAITEKLGFVFGIKFCYLDTKEVRCVKRSDPNNRDADEHQGEPGSDGTLFTDGTGEKRNADILFTGTMPLDRPFTELFECKDGETLICLDEIELLALGSALLDETAVCYCYKCRSPDVFEPKKVSVDEQAGLVELEIGKSGGPNLECPEVEGVIKFRADLAKPDGTFNERMFSDADFLLEGCVTALFPFDTCLANVIVPGLGEAIGKLKDGAEAVGVTLDFGALFLEACVYLKSLGYEDQQCAAPKEMPLNPGIKGAAGYVMENTVTLPKITRQCVITRWQHPVTWWERNGCCAKIKKCKKVLGKNICVSVNTCVDCAKTRWEERSREDCVDVITGFEEKSVASVRAALDLDMPLEIQCMSHREFLKDGFGMGISFKAGFEVSSDLFPKIGIKKEFTIIPWDDPESCTKGYPEYIRNGYLESSPSIEKSYNFENREQEFSFSWFDLPLGPCVKFH